MGRKSRLKLHWGRRSKHRPHWSYFRDEQKTSCTNGQDPASCAQGVVEGMLSQRNAAGFVTLILVALSASAQTTATTSTDTPSSPQFPPIGIAVSETAQVNVTNTALPPFNGGAAPICNGTVVFYGGADGRTIVGPVTAFQVQYGQISSVPLPYALTGASGSRAVIRVEITLSPVLFPTAAGPVVSPCTLATSLETYDTVTGVTHAVVSRTMTNPPAVSEQAKASGMAKQ